MAKETLQFEFDARITKLEKGLLKAQGQIDKTSGKAKKMGNSISAALAGGAVAAFATNFVKSTLKVGAEMESTETKFRVMLGSVEETQKTLGQLYKFANETPFMTNQVVNAGRQLLAFNVKTEDLEKTLKSVGDVAAGTGVSIIEMSAIYGKALSKNKLQAEELNNSKKEAYQFSKLLVRCTIKRQTKYTRWVRLAN